MTPQERILQLRRELHGHNHNYYVLNSPAISDYEFDMLLKELQELEAAHPEMYDPNSPSLRVGSDITKEFRQVQHKYPMLSLGNTYSKAEVAEFFDRVKRALNEDFEICCELKFDGTSISLTYVDGKLVRAVTRGDGEKGDMCVMDLGPDARIDIHIAWRSSSHVWSVIEDFANLLEQQVKAEGADE